MGTALESMRVLDMTQYEAGTSATQQLAWLGAEVVKIEPPQGDPGRRVAANLDVMPQYFVNYNSNKESVVINLKTQEGRALFLRLVPRFDVFIENYGAGVIEALDIGYDVLKAINPGIIYGRIKGFGLSGPYSAYNSYDWVAQAAAGTFSVTGEADGPPMMPGPTVGDSGTGLQMALAITAAFVQRQRTGQGQFIEVSMQEAVTLFMRTQGLATWGKAPGARMGNRRGAPTNVYPCQGGGPNDYVFIFIVTTAQWDALCAAMGKPELLADPRFEDGAARMAHADVLHEEIEGWTRQRTKQEAMRILASAGVPCSAVFDTYEVFNDPHLRERGFFETVRDANGAEYTIMGSPARMSGSKVSLRAAPVFGQHTRTVLAKELDLSAKELDRLCRDGAILAWPGAQ